MVVDIEKLEEMDASELHARRLNAKEVLTPQRSGNFIFTVAVGTVKIFGKEQRLRTSTLTRERPEGDLLKQRKFKHVHLKTARVSMLSRLMIEQDDVLKTQLQYKPTLKYIMKPKRSTLTMRHFVKELRQTWISKFQDYHILW